MMVESFGLYSTDEVFIENVVKEEWRRDGRKLQQSNHESIADGRVGHSRLKMHDFTYLVGLHQSTFQDHGSRLTVTIHSMILGCESPKNIISPRKERRHCNRKLLGLLIRKYVRVLG